eukprot:6811460-Pyramimonas_sp.AAC.1
MYDQVCIHRAHAAALLALPDALGPIAFRPHLRTLASVQRLPKGWEQSENIDMMKEIDIRTRTLKSVPRCIRNGRQDNLTQCLTMAHATTLAWGEGRISDAK